MWKVIDVILFVVVSVTLGLMLCSAVMADSLGFATKGDQVVNFTVMNSVTNTAGVCMDHSLNQVWMSFDETGTNDKTVFLQHARSISGPWVNTTVTGLTITAGDSDSYVWGGDIGILPCVRLHTEDTDFGVSNTVTGYLYGSRI